MLSVKAVMERKLPMENMKMKTAGWFVKQSMGLAIAVALVCSLASFATSAADMAGLDTVGRAPRSTVRATCSS